MVYSCISLCQLVSIIIYNTRIKIFKGLVFIQFSLQVQDQRLRSKASEDSFESRERSYGNPSIAETQWTHAEKSQRTLGDRMRGFSPDRRERRKKQSVNISFDGDSKSGTR